MFVLSPALKEQLAWRLAARTGLQLRTCRKILAGRYRKYSLRIRRRALAGINSILATDAGTPSAQDSSVSNAIQFLGNLANAMRGGFEKFGSNVANHLAPAVIAVVTGGSEGGEGDGDGGDEGDEEEAGEDEQEK